MGRSRAEKASLRSHTLPSSPSRSVTSSSSSSDFEFNICSSPRNNSAAAADDLFYKGKLLPLHLSPRLSMVRTLLLASNSASTSTSTSASRDSSGSSDAVLFFADYNCDSSRPSSVADLDDDFLKRPPVKKSSKYFSLAKISSVFKKLEPKTTAVEPAKKRMSAADVFKKLYTKKVKPLYEKLSHQKQKVDGSTSLMSPSDPKSDGSVNNASGVVHSSFSGNLWYPNKRKGVVSSCPSSMRSSPCHSGVLTRAGLPHPIRTCSSNSSMEELQSAIQGAIAHCRNSQKASSSSSSAGQ